MFNLNENLNSRSIEISIVSYHIKKSFHSLKILNENQEKSLIKTLGEIEENIDQIIDTISEDQKVNMEMYIEHLHGEELDVLQEMQRLQRYSLLLTVFAFFESKLKELCLEIEKDLSLKIKLNDLNKTKGDLFKYWTFLVKIFEINPEKLEDSFHKICEHKKIRNSISHSDGIITQNDFDALKKIPNIIFTKINNVYFIKLDENYLYNFINQIEIFTSELLNQIDLRYRVIYK